MSEQKKVRPLTLITTGLVILLQILSIAQAGIGSAIYPGIAAVICMFLSPRWFRRMEDLPYCRDGLRDLANAYAQRSSDWYIGILRHCS